MFCFSPSSEFLKYQLENQVSGVEMFDGLYWFRNIYSSLVMDGPSDILDCMHECVNVQVWILPNTSFPILHMFVRSSIKYVYVEFLTNL
jgi:hypothetical protein